MPGTAFLVTEGDTKCVVEVVLLRMVLDSVLAKRSPSDPLEQDALTSTPV